MAKPDRSLPQRIVGLDPFFSMASRLWDWASPFLPFTASSLVAGMTAYLGTMTDWARLLGPLGIGLIALISGLGAWLVISFVRTLSAQRARERVQAAALDEWKRHSGTANPAARDFREERVSVFDLTLPGEKFVTNKSFTRCEIIGPAITSFGNGTAYTRCSYINCDAIVCPDQMAREPYNAVSFNGCVFNECVFHRVTFIIAEKFYFDETSHPINWISIVPKARPSEALFPKPQSPQGTEIET